MKSATMFYEMNEFKGNLPKGWKTGYLEALAVFKSAEMEYFFSPKVELYM